MRLIQSEFKLSDKSSITIIEGIYNNRIFDLNAPILTNAGIATNLPSKGYSISEISRFGLRMIKKRIMTIF
jgi:hypothetical protein